MDSFILNTSILAAVVHACNMPLRLQAGQPVGSTVLCVIASVAIAVFVGVKTKGQTDEAQ
jgi:hypothetical protein